MQLRLLLSASLVLSAVQVCTGATTPTINFDRQVRPILSDNCFTCHGPDEKHRMAGLHFDTKEEATAYCERKGIPYQVIEPKASAHRQLAYADNFAFRRGEPWTH